MFYFNRTDSIVADFGIRTGWLTIKFFIHPYTGNKETQLERNMWGYF